MWRDSTKGRIRQQISPWDSFIGISVRRCAVSLLENEWLPSTRQSDRGVLSNHIEQAGDSQVGANLAKCSAKDYMSKTPGFVTGLLHKHDLPTLQGQRERLHLSFMYKPVVGLVPSVPADTFMTPQKQGRWIRFSRSTVSRKKTGRKWHPKEQQKLHNATLQHRGWATFMILSVSPSRLESNRFSHEARERG